MNDTQETKETMPTGVRVTIWATVAVFWLFSMWALFAVVIPWTLSEDRTPGVGPLILLALACIGVIGACSVYDRYSDQ